MTQPRERGVHVAANLVAALSEHAPPGLAASSAIMLAQIRWLVRQRGEDGWVSRTTDEFKADTGLGRRTQLTVRGFLREIGIVQERLGGGKRVYFRVDDAELARVLNGTPERARAREPQNARGRANRTRGGARTSPLIEKDFKSAASSSDEAPAATSRKDPLWDALVQGMGFAPPATKRLRGAWNVALKEIRLQGGTPEQILERCTEYRRRWPNVDITPMAIAKHWTKLGVPRGGPTRPEHVRLDVVQLDCDHSAPGDCPGCDRPICKHLVVGMCLTCREEAVDHGRKVLAMMTGPVVGDSA